MGKPRMIILIRHAQSEGNKNRAIHQTIPDHRVKLTPEGVRQAEEAGKRLRSMLRPDDTLHFFTSPYRRTRETTEGILKSLTSDDPSPSPFPRHTIKVYEEPRLREQDFGNFQPCSAEMERMWQERADYGHFFYRIANGESAADAYDRISGFNETLWRLFGEEDFPSVCVLVTHGLMTRVFLMKWYHFSVEYFEDLRNINHCEFIVMNKKPDSGRYNLENKLRTWSDLRRERALAAGQDPVAATLEPHVPIRRKWGGCPDGCDHGRVLEPRSRSGSKSNIPLGKKDTKRSTPVFDEAGSVVYASSDDLDSEKDGLTLERFTSNPLHKAVHAALDGTNPTSQKETSPPRPQHPRYKSFDQRMALLQIGRDGGGTRSGAHSRTGSDDDEEASDGVNAHHQGQVYLKKTQRRRPSETTVPRISIGAQADDLGDLGDTDEGQIITPEDTEEDREEKSVRESVF